MAAIQSPTNIDKHGEVSDLFIQSQFQRSRQTPRPLGPRPPPPRQRQRLSQTSFSELQLLYDVGFQARLQISSRTDNKKSNPRRKSVDIEKIGGFMTELGKAKMQRKNSPNLQRRHTISVIP